MIDHPRVRIVFNPKAGQAADQAAVDEAMALWQRHGWQVELTPTTYAGHAIVLARTAAEEGYDLVVAAGGDGTVNEVVNGVAGTMTAMAALPVGTGNVWVRELKLPLRPQEAAAVLLNGSVHRLDLGQAGERYFLMMAGIGFDAEVTRQVDPATKRRLGLVAYALRAIGVARRLRGTPVRLMLDGRPVKGRALMVVIGNSRLYGGFLQIAHHASPVDGLLDVVVIKGGDMRVAPLHLISILLRQHHFNPDLDYYRARELSVQSMVPLDVQVDGDTIAHTPMTFRVVPGAIQALLPDASYGQLRAFAIPAGGVLQSSVRRLRSWIRSLVVKVPLLLILLVVLCSCRLGGTAAQTATTKPVVGKAPVQAVGQTDVTVKGRLLYVQNSQLWLHSGTAAQPLDLGGAVGAGVWSHDGSRIAFVRRGESFADLYVVTVATRQVARITYNDSKAEPRSRDYVHQTLWAAQPTWADDDSAIIFAGQSAPATTEDSANPIYEYPFTLYRYALKQIGKREPNNDDQLPISSDNDLQSPAWSPDGTTVAYVEAPRQQGERRIMRYDVQAETTAPFAGVPSNAYDPVWSPDGSLLAFAATENGATDIWVVASDGGTPQRITKLGRGRAPTWSPDGSQLACINVGNDGTDVFIVDLKRTGAQLTAGEARALTKGGQIDATAGLSWGK